MASQPALKQDAHTILLVDEMPDNLRLLGKGLEACGHRVVLAAGSDCALKWAALGNPDLIVLDLDLSDMGGLETMRRLKADPRSRDIPVLFVAAADDAQGRLQGFSAGGADCITKPVSLREVLARVGTHLELCAMRRQLAARERTMQQEAAARRQVEEELQTSQEELEHRITERTLELARANAELQVEIAEREKTATLRRGESRLLEMIATSSSLEDVLAELARLIESQQPGALCSILLLASDGLHLRRGVGPSLPAGFLDALDGMAIGPAAGVCGTAVYRRKAVVAEDVMHDPLCVDYRELAQAHHLRTCWSTPIMSHDGRPLGSFALYYRERHAPNAAERGLIDFATRIARIAIEHKRAEERIRYIADHDILTGLATRTVLRDRVQLAIGQAHRNGCMMALLFIDLDNFKYFNDSLGHSFGDRLLKEVAVRLTHCLREGDSVARIGGDEFVIVLPALAAAPAAAHAGAKVLDALAKPFVIDDRQAHISASIGISLYPTDGGDVESLMRASDTAMYHAKDKGRANCQFFTPRLNEAVQRRLAIADRLRQGLEHGEFLLHYQPQVDLADGRIFSAEALLRWRPPGRVPIGSSEFIPIAEETGLILPIGAWALREACKQLVRWRKDGHRDFRIAVNLSARQFQQEDLQALATEVLDDSGLPATALELEITESLLMQKDSENLAIMQGLTGMGVELSLDDFGTGYSSLAYLQRFPIRALKIDQSFVNGIGHNDNDTAIVTAILAMAHSMHLKVIAEGVENAGQESFLKSHGCEAAQGYYYSAPVPAEDLGAMLEESAV